MNDPRLTEWVLNGGSPTVASTTTAALRRYDFERAGELLGLFDIVLLCLSMQGAIARNAENWAQNGKGLNVDTFISGQVGMQLAKETAEERLPGLIRKHRLNFVVVPSGSGKRTEVVMSADQYIILGEIAGKKVSIREVLNTGDVGSVAFRHGTEAWSVHAAYNPANARIQGRRDQGTSVGTAALVGGILGGTTGAIIGAAYASDKAKRDSSYTRLETGMKTYSGQVDHTTCLFQGLWDPGMTSTLVLQDAQPWANGTDSVSELVERAMKSAPEARALRMDQLAWIESRGDLADYVPCADAYLASVSGDPAVSEAAASAKAMLDWRGEDLRGSARERRANQMKAIGCLALIAIALSLGSLAVVLSFSS